MSEINNTSKIKNRQNLMLLWSIGILVSICAVILYFSEGTKTNTENTKDQVIKFDNITNAADAEDRWLEIAETKLTKLEENLKSQQLLSLQLTDNVKKLTQEIKTSKAALPEMLDGDVNSDLSEQINILTQRLSNLEDKKSSLDLSEPDPFLNSNNNDGFANLPSGSTITQVDITLKDKKSIQDNAKSIKNYIPAGSYASAIIISGVDAPVGVSAQSDPRPMLFRITSPAVSSIHGETKMTTDITGCLVTAAAYGDLSSEKVFVRLLNMTCAAGAGKVTEVAIKGYAAAVGRAGIRGDVISREGDFISKSFAAGMMSGLGSGISQRMSNPSSINGGVALQERADAKDIAGQGVGSGVEKSADRLADYLINRAEQYQPVISVGSGFNVELVFQEGVELSLTNKEKDL